MTPQKTATMPIAAQRDGANPARLPKKHPNAAPTQKEGTISPPLKPPPSVTAVKSILIRKAAGNMVSS